MRCYQKGNAVSIGLPIYLTQLFQRTVAFVIEIAQAPMEKDVTTKDRVILFISPKTGCKIPNRLPVFGSGGVGL